MKAIRVLLRRFGDWIRHRGSVALGSARAREAARATLQSGLPPAVGDDEDLARFRTSSNHFATTTKRVKGAALLPDSKQHETSVYRHGAQPADRLWQIGRKTAAGTRHLHGVAIFRAKHVRAVALDVLAAEPPPRHAAIRGWPRLDGDPDLAKARQKELATAIAAHAELLLR